MRARKVNTASMLRQNLFLLFQLIRRDISARYKGSIIGILWSFVAPILLITVYTFVFSVVFKARWGGEEAREAFAMNLFAGMLVHGFIAECLSRSPTIIGQYVSYVKRVVFPVWLLPLIIVGSALFHAAIGFVVLLAVMLCFSIEIYWQIVFLPILMLPVVFFSIGICWFISALGVYIKDIVQLMPMLITVLMFMSPVFYPVAALPEQYQKIMYLNPLTPAIEATRALVFSGVMPSLSSQIVNILMSIGVVFLSYLFFSRLRRGFADVL